MPLNKCEADVVMHAMITLCDCYGYDPKRECPWPGYAKRHGLEGVGELVESSSRASVALTDYRESIKEDALTLNGLPCK
jgi:hypothetical protein